MTIFIETSSSDFLVDTVSLAMVTASLRSFDLDLGVVLRSFVAGPRSASSVRRAIGGCISYLVGYGLVVENGGKVIITADGLRAIAMEIV